MEFQRNIKKTLTKGKLNDGDEAEALYEWIVIIEEENECLKNEVRSQKEIYKHSELLNEKRNTNSILQEGRQNQRRPDNCSTEKYLTNHATICIKQSAVPGNKTSLHESNKIWQENNDNSQVKKIKQYLFNNSFDNAKSFIRSFGGAKTKHEICYAIP